MSRNVRRSTRTPIPTKQYDEIKTNASLRRSSRPLKSRVIEDLDSDGESISSMCSKSSRSSIETRVRTTKMKTHIERQTECSGSSQEEVEVNKKSNFSETSPRKHKPEMLPSDEPTTPRKQRRTNCETESSNEDENRIMSPKTPSSLLSKLSLTSPSGATKCPNSMRKSLFPQDIYKDAKKALHSTTPECMPGRQKEFEELESFIKTHLKEKTSGSLYISGPPGTGKTASLTLLLQNEDIGDDFKKVYVNCTSIKSSGTVYSRIIKELGLKGTAKNEKEYLSIIEKHLSKTKKMNLLVLDEMDQLESKNQSILYTIFEWPAKFKENIVLIGIANALDLTDRILPRLQARCELKPKLLNFAPYSKQQILEIITSRLEKADALKVFSPAALQMLAGKVAAVSGDLRRALDIARRVIDMIEKDAKDDVLTSVENLDVDEFKTKFKAVDLKEVAGVLNQVYGTTQNLSDDCDSSFPLQQKIVICSLLLILQKSKNKDVTIGRLHDVYKKICIKRNLFSVDQAEFVGLCSLIETKGILRVSGRKEPRLHKVTLEWDQGEVIDAVRDKMLISSILQDDSVIGKLR